jgi:hypothetical protein
MTILSNLVIETLNRVPQKSWPPNELVDAIKAKTPTAERVSSAEIKSAIWRLVGDHQISMTPDLQIEPVTESEPEP